jgi:acyl-CoA synthetase (AMP-forming)/AMP-acid ligase II
MAVPNLNFGDLFEAVADAIPERTAIIYGDHQVSWRQFDQRSTRLARNLAGSGLKPGSKVAFYLRNSPAYLELFFACAKGRFTHANVNYRYVDHELFHVLDNSDAEAVVYDASYAEQIQSLQPRLSKVKTYLSFGEDVLNDFSSDFEAACCQGDDSALDVQRSGDDQYFMYTGGTTGYPKAVVWRHKDRIAVIGMTDAQDAQAHGVQVKASPGPVVLPACPLMHSTGLTTAMVALVSGGCIVLLPNETFDAESCLSEIDKHKVERVAIVGDAFSIPILDCLRQYSDQYDLSSVQLISSAGAMWSEPRKRELLEYFPNATLSDSLGSSEGSRLGSSIMTRGESIGTACFKVGPSVKVFSEDFKEVEAGSGEAGMIAKAGPMPLGYYKDEAGTEKTFPTIDGVRYSMAGDWCRIEKDGTMTLLGRGNNCINSGGEKIYPEEVEEGLKQVPEILDAAVIGMPDERWGQAVTALIRMQQGKNFDEEQVTLHLKAGLARYKHPKVYKVVADDFRHDNGKINYRAAQAMLEG